MIHLVTALVLFLTIVLAVAIGVGSGYLIISGILNAFARKPQKTEQATATALAAQGMAGD